ncbi:MAG: hypothetical protein WCB90_13665 [Methanosarcina sp.]|jgi:hypothetical protein|uniref:hypothetical protein n=1 Tax=Methanosarcina sp. TaxID=2213 RepID=UPI003BB7C257
MRKLLAIALVLCIFTAMAVGTAAAKAPQGKVVQNQVATGTGIYIGISQAQVNSAFINYLGAGTTISQFTIAKAIVGTVASQQSTVIKISA